MIAEAQVEVGEEDKAKEVMDKASQLDPDATQIKEASAKMAVFSGNIEIAKALMSELDSLSNVLSYMNNKAVASARCGRYDEGIQLYEKTITSIPEDRKDLSHIVRYNLGLAKVRGGDLEGALKELEFAMKDPNSRVFKKAQSLHKRTKKALETGADLTIKDDEKTPGKSHAVASPPDATNSAASEATINDLHEAIVASVTPRKGDICCYMIFTNLDSLDDRVKPLLATMPKFQRRKAIERAEALGVERTNKKAG
jgi:tetratricopeptide (TPR) repeat protein